MITAKFLDCDFSKPYFVDFYEDIGRQSNDLRDEVRRHMPNFSGNKPTDLENIFFGGVKFWPSPHVGFVLIEVNPYIDFRNVEYILLLLVQTKTGKIAPLSLLSKDRSIAITNNIDLGQI
jgi:hypothetical protein